MLSLCLSWRFLRIMCYVVWYSWQFLPAFICGSLSCDLCVWVECLDGDSSMHVRWVMLSSLRPMRLACWLKGLGASLSRAIFSWMANCRSLRPGLGIAQCHTTFPSGVMLNVIGVGSGFGVWDKEVGRHFAWWVSVAGWSVKLQIQPSNYFQWRLRTSCRRRSSRVLLSWRLT